MPTRTHHPRRGPEQDRRHLACVAGGNQARPALRIPRRRACTRRMTGTASTRASSLVDPYATAIASLPGRDFRAAVGYDPSSALKDLSFSEIDDAAAAPKCVVTHEDFDWQGDQPLRHPVDIDRHLRAPRARLHHRIPVPECQFPGTYRGLIEKIPHLKDLGITAVELMPIQEFNEHDVSRVDPTTGERLKNFWGYDPRWLLRAQGFVRERPPGRRAGPRVQGDGSFAASGRHRSDSGRGLQPHGRRQRMGSYVELQGLENRVYYMLENGSGPTATTPAAATR